MTSRPAPDPGQDPGLRPSRVVDMHVDHDDGGRITVLFDTDGGDVPVFLSLDQPTMHALSHCAALHGHTGGCGGNLGQDVQVDLLIRALAASGTRAGSVVVRSGPEPAFWLRVECTSGPRHLDLGVLDALVLLMSERLPVHLDAPIDDAPNDAAWDLTFERLLADGRPDA